MYHFPDGEVVLWHEFLDEEDAADTPFCRWYASLDSSSTLDMEAIFEKWFGVSTNFCSGASAW